MAVPGLLRQLGDRLKKKVHSTPEVGDGRYQPTEKMCPLRKQGQRQQLALKLTCVEWGDQKKKDDAIVELLMRRAPGVQASTLGGNSHWRCSLTSRCPYLPGSNSTSGSQSGGIACVTADVFRKKKKKACESYCSK